MLARVGRLGLNCPGDPGCPGNPIVLPGTSAIAVVTDTGGSAIEDLGTGAVFTTAPASPLAQLGGSGTLLAIGGAALLLVLVAGRRR